MANILYQKLRQQYSLDGGATWNYVYNAYKVGDIIENPSNCTSSDSKQYRWVELPIAEGYTCDPTTYTKYTVEVEEVSNNGGLTWTRTGNQRQANVYEENSVDCGYSGSTSGDTSECDNETLSFDFEGDSLVYRMGEDMVTTYTATTSPYSVTLSELGIDHNKLEIYAIFSGTNITNLYSMPCAHNVKNANQLFDSCELLKSVNLSDFTTNNNATLNGMFSGCKSLTTLNLNNLVTSNVVEISGMFWGCTSLASLDLSNWDTSNVINMGSMFGDCTSLTALDLSDWNTSNATSMNYMFYYCTNLKTLNLSNWDITKVYNISSMFEGCTSLTTIKMKNCSQSTIDKITSALTDVGLENQVTIIT